MFTIHPHGEIGCSPSIPNYCNPELRPTESEADWGVAYEIAHVLAMANADHAYQIRKLLKEIEQEGGYKVGDKVRCKLDEDDDRFAYHHFKGEVTAVVEEGSSWRTAVVEVYFEWCGRTNEFSVDEVRPALCPTMLHAPAPATDAASPAH